MSKQWYANMVKMENTQKYAKINGSDFIDKYFIEKGWTGVLFCYIWGSAFEVPCPSRTSYMIKVVEKPYSVDLVSRKIGGIELSKRKSKKPQFYIGDIPIYQKILGTSIYY